MGLPRKVTISLQKKNFTVGRGLEFCSNYGLRAVVLRANLGLSWPTSEGLRVGSSHLYCFPRRMVGSGHQSGSHPVSQNEMCPTCAHWKLAERHGCYTGMQAAPWITLVPKRIQAKWIRPSPRTILCTLGPLCVDLLSPKQP